MSAEPKFQIGEDLFVREPQRFIPDCTCIVGPVMAVVANKDGSIAYVIQGSVGRVWPNRGEEIDLTFQERDVAHRLGTPLSQLSGRPGHDGFAAFCRIARSWGYD